MRLGWRIPLPGPFSLGGTIWRSKPRRRSVRVYHGTYGGKQCPHNHHRPDTAQDCGDAMARAARRR
jgi:hypothetical protein